MNRLLAILVLSLAAGCATSRGARSAPGETPAYTPPPPPPPISVTIDPPPGAFAAPVKVTLASPTAEAVIHYTTDGSAPDGWSPTYAGPFTVDRTMRVRAIVMAASASGTATVEGEYVIAPPPLSAAEAAKPEPTASAVAEPATPAAPAAPAPAVQPVRANKKAPASDQRGKAAAPSRSGGKDDPARRGAPKRPAPKTVKQ